jgi:hypothetical protein
MMVCSFLKTLFQQKEKKNHLVPFSNAYLLSQVVAGYKSDERPAALPIA